MILLLLLLASCALGNFTKREISSGSMAEELKVYMTSVSSASDIKGQQQRIFNVLDSKKIPYTKVDIATSEEAKIEMREICENPTALPPKFARGTTYLGDYEQFDFALEDGLLEDFLKIRQ